MTSYEPSINLVDNEKKIQGTKPTIFNFLSNFSKDFANYNFIGLGDGESSFLTYIEPQTESFPVDSQDCFPPGTKIKQEVFSYLVKGIDIEGKDIITSLLVFKRNVLDDSNVFLTRQDELHDWIGLLKTNSTDEQKQCVHKINGNGKPTIAYSKWIVNSVEPYKLEGKVTITTDSLIYLTQNFSPETERKILEKNKRVNST